MNCPECGNFMELTNTDSRQEGVKEMYYCDNCKNDFCRKIEFKTQSELVESDSMELVK